MISGKILRDAIISGANNINNQRSRVDELNVFPVPDGDTGTNMGMTVGSAVRELEALDDSCTVGEAAKTAASAMLRGARGNSGVITSLLFRGFSKALEGKKEADTADIIAAEDTRVTRKLLNHLQLHKPLVSYHEHNHVTAGQSILSRLEAGESCALVTDAGTPAISDPGQELVALCAENGVTVQAIPGCCAAIAALSRALGWG